MKQIVRCKDCPNWKRSEILANHCMVFNWCSDEDDGCTFESDTADAKTDEVSECGSME